jgi:hypothetical protein
LSVCFVVLFTMSHIYLIVSSVQFVLGLPTLLLSCVNCFNLLFSKQTLCVDVCFGSLIVLFSSVLVSYMRT